MKNRILVLLLVLGLCAALLSGCKKENAPASSSAAESAPIVYEAEADVKVDLSSQPEETPESETSA